MSSSELSDQLRGVAELVEEIEDSDIDAEVHDAHLDGIAVDNTQFRATLTVLAPLDDEPTETVVMEPDESDEESLDVHDSDRTLSARIVDVLEEHGELPAKEIKFLLEIANSRHHNALAELQQEGRVDARKDPEDGRRKLYRLASHDIEEADESSDADGDDASDDDSSDDDAVETDVSQDDDDDENVERPTADEIRTLRDERDWTQAELADEIGVAASTVGGWEADSSPSKPSHENAARIWTLYEESPDEAPPKDDDDEDVQDEEQESDAVDDSDDDEATESEEEASSETFPRTCHCGASLDDSLELAVHRTEKHNVQQSQLDHLEAGEFEEIADEADSVLDLADELGWSRKKTMSVLGIYGRNDFGIDVDDFIGGSTAATDGGEHSGDDRSDDVDDVEDDGDSDDSDDDHDDGIEDDGDTDGVDLQEYGVGRRELVDALEGAQSIHHVRRELGISRGQTRDLLDALDMLEKLSAGTPPISVDDAKRAVKGVA